MRQGYIRYRDPGTGRHPYEVFAIGSTERVFLTCRDALGAVIDVSASTVRLRLGSLAEGVLVDVVASPVGTGTDGKVVAEVRVPETAEAGAFVRVEAVVVGAASDPDTISGHVESPALPGPWLAQVMGKLDSVSV